MNSFGRGQNFLVWKIHLILFIFNSFYDNFYKRGIMGNYSVSNPGLKGHDVSNGKQKSYDRKVQGRSRTLGLLGVLRVTHRVIKEVGNTRNWLLTTYRKRLWKLKKVIMGIFTNYVQLLTYAWQFSDQPFDLCFAIRNFFEAKRELIYNCAFLLIVALIQILHAWTLLEAFLHPVKRHLNVNMYDFIK